MSVSGKHGAFIFQVNGLLLSFKWRTNISRQRISVLCPGLTCIDVATQGIRRHLTKNRRTHTHPAFNAFCHLCLLFLKCFCSVYYMFFLQSVAAMTWCILFSLFTFVATLIYNKIFPEHVATISKYVCFILFPCHQSPSITINHHQSPCMVIHDSIPRPLQ